MVQTLVALIAAVAAIIAPVVTAHINSKATLAIKKMELEAEHRKNTVLHEREVLEKALVALSMLAGLRTVDVEKSASENLLPAIVYLEDATGNELLTILSNITKHNAIDNKSIEKVSIAIKKKIQSLPIQ